MVSVEDYIENTSSGPTFELHDVNKEPRKEKSYLETIMYCIKGNLGIGVFAMGYVFMNSGILIGVLILSISGLITLHCQHIFLKAHDKIMKKRDSISILHSYADTIQYTFENCSIKWFQRRSKAFRIIINVFLILAELGFCTTYFMFITKHILEITKAYGWKQDYELIIVILLVPMWLITILENSKFLFLFLLLSNLTTLLGIIFFLYYATHELTHIKKQKLISHFDKIVKCFGIFLFAFEGITFIIPLQMKMKKPKAFSKSFGILNISTILIVLLCLVVGLFGFWKYGNNVKSSVMLNVPTRESFALAAQILAIIGVISSYVLHMDIYFEMFYPRIHKKWGPFEHPVLIIILYKSTAVLITYGLAHISHNLSTMISLVGALTGAILTLIFPSLLELIQVYGQLTYMTIFKNALIIMIGILAIVTGLIQSMIKLFEEYAEEEEEKK